MSLKCLFVGNRSAVLQLDDDQCYTLDTPVSVYVNGQWYCDTANVITSLWDLLPDSDIDIEVKSGESSERLQIHTRKESATLNVREFGAVGDGVHNDTNAIQAAITCCPEDGRVLVPEGTYSTCSLFLKSHIRLELAKGAVLLLRTDRSEFAILPGMIQTYDEMDDINYGSWEGNPLDCFAALLTGISVEDVIVYGRGTLDGQADQGDWWVQPKIKRGAFRPRMIFLNHCHHMDFQGITVRRSPSWNLHPYFSDDLGFYQLMISAPANSPNTDGFDPESCSRVHVSGVHFSVGDDCIAIKSGKIYMGQRYKKPCENIEIDHCLMEDGHGGVTIGSEMAGGVHDVRIHHCMMKNTDRGLRIKSRRGRGKQGRLDQICMEHVIMDQVLVPLAVNSMYYCDPDGHSPYVQDRNAHPVDERTPSIGTILMKHVQAKDAANVGYVLGLPEMPVEHLIMDDVSVQVNPEHKPMVCIMAEGIEPTSGVGLVLENVQQFDNHMTVMGQTGDPVIYK